MISSIFYNGDGSTRIFPVTFKINGEDYVRVYVDNVEVIDRTKYDIINNSIVFTSDDIPAAGTDNIKIYVATSASELGDLGAPLTDITNVSNNLAEIVAVSTQVIPNLPEILLADNNATIATNQATIATTKASEASASATSASNSATTATTKASEALANATSASNSATSASTSANTATTKANEASSSASSALTSATQALGYRNEAEAFSISNVFIVYTIEDLVTIPSNYTTAIVKDLNRGGTFVWSPTGTANGGTVFAGATGYWNRQYSGAVNVKWFGAKGDGIADDTVAIQKAIDYCIANRKQEVYIPSNNPAMYYKITDTIKITKTISLKGDGQSSTILMAVGFTLNQYVLDFDMNIADNVYFSDVSDLTVMSIDKTPIGARLSNISYLSLKNVRFYGLISGIEITGTQTFSNTFREVTFYDIIEYSVYFKSFSGGGQYLFDNCTFTGNDGFVLDATSATDSLVISCCNFEQCITSDIHINGTVNGLTITGCRSEGFDGLYSFLFRPATGKYVNGISITGCNWFSDFGNATPICIDGAVNGFTIQGNSAGYIGFQQFVYLNGAGEAGVISGNYCANSPKVVNVNRLGVVVFNNKNSSGYLPDYTKEIGVEQTWQDVTSSRTPGVTYTNNTGKPIMCIYSFASSDSAGGQGITVGGVLINRPTLTGATLEHTITTIVPNNVTYSYSTTNYPLVEKRYELR